MTPLVAGAAPTRAPAAVHVAFPAGDPGAILATGSRLLSQSDTLEQLAYRLGADAAAMTQDRRWCSPASTAYDSASRSHTGRVSEASMVLRIAGQACARFASTLAQAQAAAHVATVWADRLSREEDDLAEAWRRLTDQRAAAAASLPSPLLAGALLAQQPAVVAEQQRLVARGAALAADVARAEAQARDVAHRSSVATAELASVLSDLSRLTTASRQVAARAQHDALVAAGELPAEDGSAGSRLTGVLSGAWSNVTGPADLMVGLTGMHGDIAGHWRSLGRSLADEVEHPLQLARDLFDVADLEHHDWGRWTGTEVPGALLTAGSGGLFGVVKALRGAEALTVAHRLAEELRRAQELDELAQTQELLARLGGRPTSSLVPLGGLAWHEAAGGHALGRHVYLSLSDLESRLRDKRIPSASKFADRVQAEAAVAEVLTEKAADIARWLGSDVREEAFRADLGRPVGVILRRRASGPVPGSVVKVVLHQDASSPVGFYVYTAFLVA